MTSLTWLGNRVLLGSLVKCCTTTVPCYCSVSSLLFLSGGHRQMGGPKDFLIGEKNWCAMYCFHSFSSKSWFILAFPLYCFQCSRQVGPELLLFMATWQLLSNFLWWVKYLKQDINQQNWCLTLCLLINERNVRKFNNCPLVRKLSVLRPIKLCWLLTSFQPHVILRQRYCGQIPPGAALACSHPLLSGHKLAALAEKRYNEIQCETQLSDYSNAPI